MADAIYVTWLELLTLLEHLISPPVFLMGTVRVLLIVLVFCAVLLCVFTLRVRIKTMLGSSLPTVIIRRVHVLFTLLVLVCIYRKWCPTHIVLCFCFVFLGLVYLMLPVSVNCRHTFLIAPSALSDIYVEG